MRIAALVLAASILAPAAHAQTAPCQAFNDSNTNLIAAVTAYRFSGPGRWAWRYVPSGPATVLRGVRILTQLRAGFMTLEIWDESPAAPPQPGTRLAGGTWRALAPINAPSWQGVTLDAPLPLTPNRPVWIVWGEPGGSQIPTEPGGTPLAPALTWNGSGWMTVPATELKVRLYCTPLDTQGAQVAGSGCQGSHGGAGALFANEAPSLGNAAFRLEASGLPAGAAAFWLLGNIPNFPSVPIPGAGTCTLNTDVVLLLPGLTGTGDVRAQAAAQHMFLLLPLPNDTTWKGLFVGMQAGAIDAAASTPLPVVTTNAYRFTVF